MPYVVSDETRAHIERQLGRSPTRLPTTVPEPPSVGVQRALYIYSYAGFGGYHFAELVWRDEPNFLWGSFDPPIYCWALELNGAILENGSYYTGFLVNVEEWSGLGLPVFAVRAGGGEAAEVHPVEVVSLDADGYYTAWKFDPSSYNPATKRFTVRTAIKVVNLADTAYQP